MKISPVVYLLPSIFAFMVTAIAITFVRNSTQPNPVTANSIGVEKPRSIPAVCTQEMVPCSDGSEAPRDPYNNCQATCPQPASPISHPTATAYTISSVMPTASTAPTPTNSVSQKNTAIPSACPYKLVICKDGRNAEFRNNSCTPRC